MLTIIGYYLLGVVLVYLWPVVWTFLDVLLILAFSRDEVKPIPLTEVAPRRFDSFPGLKESV